MQAVEIRKALEYADHNFCFDVARKSLKNYRRLLNPHAFLTEASIIDVTWEEAHSKGVGYWKDALKYGCRRS